MDNLPVGRIEQLSYNDKLKADIAAMLAAKDRMSEKGRLQAEVARLKAENEALMAWGFKAYTELLNTRILLDTGRLNLIRNLIEDAPDSVKGSE